MTRISVLGETASTGDEGLRREHTEPEAPVGPAMRCSAGVSCTETYYTSEHSVLYVDNLSFKTDELVELHSHLTKGFFTLQKH